MTLKNADNPDGDDSISPEVMKRVDIDDVILKFCNDALCDGLIPDQWKLSKIVPVPKKGNLTKTDNYREISLTSIVSKTLNKMLLNRMKPSLEEVLRDNQNGGGGGGGGGQWHKMEKMENYSRVFPFSP